MGLKKTSIYLDEELDHALARRAADEDLSKAELIRQTLSASVQSPRRPKPTIIGIVNSGRGDISENVDDYLTETGFGRE